MSSKVLVCDGDYQLLRHACGALRASGWDVLIETAFGKSLTLAGISRPLVVVAPVECLHHWQEHRADELESLRLSCELVVTADAEDHTCPWLAWATRGCQILIKPLVHCSQLVSAVEAAAAARGLSARPSSKPPNAGAAIAV